MKIPRLAAFTLGAALLTSCANPIIDYWAFPEAELSARWTAHGIPVPNALLDLRGFPAGQCGPRNTAASYSTVRLDTAGRYSGRIHTNPPVDTITRCMTVTFLAPYTSGARDTTIVVGDVTFRGPGANLPLDSIRIVVDQP